MNKTPRRWTLLLLLSAQLISLPGWAHTAAEDMTEAAQHFLAALTPEQRTKATFEFAADERLNWHFIPRDRKGLPLKDMTTPQRHLAYAFLNSAMSQRGFMKATTIMSLEQILLEIEKGSGPKRDSELYFFTIFGKPEAAKTWGWRVEGHHLSLNFTVGGDGQIATTPSFLGSNPGEVRTESRKGLRVLNNEEDLARKLVKSLNGDQKQIAIYTNKAPNDIITAADRKARLLEPQGLSMAKMDKAQAELLWNIIKEYVERYRNDVASKDLEEIQNGGLDKVYFAWAGSTEVGEGHYYRIQGPGFLMEYDNTQNGANHVHAVWRDLKNDFGEDLLGKHYNEDHKK